MFCKKIIPEFRRAAKKFQGWLTMAEYASTTLNISNYPWKCLKNCSDYARVLNIPDHLACSTDFWRGLEFQICQNSEYGMVLYVRVTQNPEYDWEWLSTVCMTDYTSIVREYASVFLIVPECPWTWLNIDECPWMRLKISE